MQNADRIWLCYSKLIHFFSKPKSFSHEICSVLSFYDFMILLLSKIVFYGVQKLKGKRVFRKIGIIHVWHIVISVAQKLNSVNFRNSSCKLAMLSKVSYQKIQNRKSSGNSDIQN